MNSMKPTGPTNPITKKLVSEIKEKGYTENIKFLVNLGKQLEKSRRNRTSVNLIKLQRVCKDGETVLILGKLLSYGDLDKKITVSALSASGAALDKLKKSGSKFITIKDLIKQNPNGKNIRLIK